MFTPGCQCTAIVKRPYRIVDPIRLLLPIPIDRTHAKEQLLWLVSRMPSNYSTATSSVLDPRPKDYHCSIIIYCLSVVYTKSFHVEHE